MCACGGGIPFERISSFSSERAGCGYYDGSGVWDILLGGFFYSALFVFGGLARVFVILGLEGDYWTLKEEEDEDQA